VNNNLTNALKENSNPITKRIAVRCKMRLLAPALIGSGEEENTDRDVYLDANSHPLIPGTSLAGVMRSAFSDKYAAMLFGPLIDAPTDKSATSPLWVLDSPVLTDDGAPAKIIIIDNVALDEGKVAKPGAKFDFEAIESGSYFYLRLQLIMRESSPGGLEGLLDGLLGKLSTLYIGGKASGGFGKLKCEGISKVAFDASEAGLKNWMDFKWDKIDQSPGATQYATFPEYTPEEPAFMPEPGVISATLKLKGSLLIRDDYSVTGEEDSAQITSDGKPVIYGTSLVGAIKGGLARFLDPDAYPSRKQYLDYVFGYIDEKSEQKRHYPSKVRVDATYFAHDNRHPVTRVKINRWTGGAADRALFTSCPQFNGSVTLTAYYPSGNKEIMQLFTLALQAIDLGIITIGGETGIGRGVFTVEEIHINGAKQVKEDLFKLPKNELRKQLSNAAGGVINE